MIKIIGISLGVIFSGMTTYGFISSNECSNNVLIIEGVGQALIIISIIMNFLHFDKVFVSLMCLGLSLIIISCIFNGMNMYGHVHISHHVVRIMFSVIIVVLCGWGMKK